MSSKTRRKTYRAAHKLSAARLASVQALYEIAISERKPEVVINTFVRKYWRSVTLRDPDTKPGFGGKARLPNPDHTFLKEVVLGVTTNKKNYEKKIQSVLENNWTINRLDILMGVLLKSVTYEFEEKKEIPIGVIVGEYSDLAHAFFDDKDAKFATRIINLLAEQIRKA